VSAAALAFGLAACSAGGAGTSPTVESTPKVSLSPETTDATTPPSEPANAEFANMVEFTRLVHVGDIGRAGSLVADNSAAARYIAHQNALKRFNELNGQPSDRNEDDFTIDGDEKAGSIRIEFTGNEPTVYTWKEFKVDGLGKILSWTGKSGPIDKILWHQASTAKTHGVTVKLLTAYVNNGGDLNIVVELSSAKRTIRVDDAIYTPRDGYRQQDSASHYAEVDKGEKALTLFQFDNVGTLGGKLKLGIGRLDPSDSSSSYALGTINLAVK
jgi:hypothetical protein